MASGVGLSRREFLKFSGVNIAALACSRSVFGLLAPSPQWPSLQIEQLPSQVQAILQLAPDLEIASEGHLLVRDLDSDFMAQAPLAVTVWNQENSTHADRLYSHVPWGIVLHWYGDRETFDRSIKGYLRGFDSLREVDGEILRTSAHFLVGEGKISASNPNGVGEIGILQTQAPAKDGTPYVASHLRPLNYQAHLDRKQYFVRALYQLSYTEPGVHSLLQDLYDGPKLDPNMRTIAIEITGLNFDKPDGFPSNQKVANVVSLVWALMKRYRIPAANLLGHHEIQLSKADPGKKFMNTIRYLIGVKALVDQDEQMKGLVFGQFLSAEENSCLRAVRRYFKTVRSYLVLVGAPHVTYEWEAESKYWQMCEAIDPSTRSLTPVREYCHPLAWEDLVVGNFFLRPENHNGVDLFLRDERSTRATIQQRARLIAAGKCLFAGSSQHCQGGHAAIFRHRQADGAEVLSVYSHLKEPGDIRIGNIYPAGYWLGSLDEHSARQDFYLHFSVAYGASWDIGLNRGPDIPLNAGVSWIRQRYIEPLEYLAKHTHDVPEDVIFRDSMR